jgi:hypothetical protein
MAEELIKPEELLDISPNPPDRDWMEPNVEFKKGTYCHSAVPKHQGYLGLPNPRTWQPYDEDWQLPPDWKDIILKGMKERIERNRSIKVFLDICVRCGACGEGGAFEVRV